MAERIRGHDWEATPLGAVSGWSGRLKVMVEQVLANPIVASLACGPERLLIYNDAAARLYGDRHPAALGRPLAETFPAGWATVAPFYARAFAGETVRVGGQPLDTRGEGIGGEGTWEGTWQGTWTEVFDALLLPVREEDGRIAHVHAITPDVGGRIAAEAALRDNEERLRESEERLRQFGDASSDVLWMREAESLQWVYLTPAFAVTYDRDRAAALRGDTMTNWLDLVLPEDHPSVLSGIARVRDGERVAFEYRIRRPGDGAVRWLRDTDFPMRDAAGAVRWIGGISRDITEEKETAERMQVLVAELQHRTRNLLGVVKALFHETARRSDSLDAFRELFGERLDALARVNALLSRSGEPRITIGELVRTALDALGGSAAAGRIRLDGPEVRLRSSIVQTLALALHELATNARKYGALADERGRLEVTWSTHRPDGEGERLVVEWVEHGRAPTQDKAEPPRHGYGRELIERALPYALKARTRYELSGEGVRCSLDLPLTRAPRRERPTP